jgi:hypothetical protein
MITELELQASYKMYVGERMLLIDHRVAVITAMTAWPSGSEPNFAAKFADGHIEMVTESSLGWIDYFGKDNPETPLRDCPWIIRRFQRWLGDTAYGSYEQTIVSSSWVGAPLRWLSFILLKRLGYHPFWEY